METMRFGRTGLAVSRIAFGGIPIQRLTRAEGIGLVRAALGAGVTFLDTAHGYGQSEECIGVLAAALWSARFPRSRAESSRVRG